MLSKAKRFKLNILKAFMDSEEKSLQKAVWGAMIEDELPEVDLATAPPAQVTLPPSTTMALPEALGQKPQETSTAVVTENAAQDPKQEAAVQAPEVQNDSAQETALPVGSVTVPEEPKQ